MLDAPDLPRTRRLGRRGMSLPRDRLRRRAHRPPLRLHHPARRRRRPRRSSRRTAIPLMRVCAATSLEDLAQPASSSTASSRFIRRSPRRRRMYDGEARRCSSTPSPRLTATARTSTARTCSRPAATRAYRLKDGWMNRLLGLLPARRSEGDRGLADGADGAARQPRGRLLRAVEAAGRAATICSQRVGELYARTRSCTPAVERGDGDAADGRRR